MCYSLGSYKQAFSSLSRTRNPWGERCKEYFVHNSGRKRHKSYETREEVPLGGSRGGSARWGVMYDLALTRCPGGQVPTSCVHRGSRTFSQKKPPLTRLDKFTRLRSVKLPLAAGELQNVSKHKETFNCSHQSDGREKPRCRQAGRGCERPLPGWLVLKVWLRHFLRNEGVRFLSEK